MNENNHYMEKIYLKSLKFEPFKSDKKFSKKTFFKSALKYFMGFMMV